IDYRQDLADAIERGSSAGDSGGDVFITGPLDAERDLPSQGPDDGPVLVPGNGRSAQGAVVDGVNPIHTSASARAAARWGLRTGETTQPKDAGGTAAEQSQVKTLGTVISNLVATTQADNVVVAISRRYHRLLSKVIAELQHLPVHIVLMPDVADLTIL